MTGSLSGVALGEGFDVDTTTIEPPPTRLTAPDRTGQPVPDIASGDGGLVPALPRPVLPPGAHRDLNEALHDLHHRAGWPSLRTLAKAAGCSHTTVSVAFSSPQTPTWGVLALVVEGMRGDVAHFHALWLAASTPLQPSDPSRPAIAGRRSELAAVRRHIESGSGLLLVTGEAGMGKTTLVRSATANVAAFVATGACLPLSTEVPLLPIADALRSIYEHDSGQWLKDALASCPAYVADTLPRLLPELPGEHVTVGAGSGSLLHLFSAVSAVLAELSELRPLAVVVEDLHWADSTTLDLVEQLANRPRVPRVVGTWRLEDAGTPEDKLDWFARVRRARDTRLVELSPLTAEETAAQLKLVSGTEPKADLVLRIHARSAGHPLFTEHLATQAQDADLPRLLVDLLDRRLGVLTGAEWDTARTLGLADRGLSDDLLQRSTGVAHETITTALHELHARRLIAPQAGEVRLSHPLLAEAVRRRVMPGEAAEGHRQLALALATAPDASAAEIAAHWQAAGNRTEELRWRVAAANEAAQRLGPAQEAAQWLRALDLWPVDDAMHGAPAIGRAQAAFRAMDALWFAGRAEQVDSLLVDLMPHLDEFPRRDAAELLAIAGRSEAAFRSRETALQLLERAVALFESEGPSRDLVMCLRQYAGVLVDLGRRSDAAAVLDRAWQVNASVGDDEQSRLLLSERAWRLFEAGRRREAVATMQEAVARRSAVPDPFVDVTLAKQQADLLLEAGRSAADVVAAARRGIALAEELALDSLNVGWLRFDLGTALARSGDVAGAAELVDPLSGEEGLLAHHPVELIRADLDIRRGLLDDARTLAELATHRRRAFSLDVRSKWCALLAEIELWQGQAAQGFDRLVPLLRELADLDEVVYAAAYFLLATRAAADLAEAEMYDPTGRTRLAQLLVGIRSRSIHEPLAHDPAHRVSWDAELSRLDGTATVDHWVRAAGAWARLGRPHDSAYCGWRGAQVALADGQGTVAGRLLRRAAADARQHVPLSDAIARTAAYPAQS
jgi:tetratricopeptide (TPR) repeat protein